MGLTLYRRRDNLDQVNKQFNKRLIPYPMKSSYKFVLNLSSSYRGEGD